MSEENKNASAGQAGSANDLVKSTPSPENNGGSGELEKKAKNNNELEKIIGEKNELEKKLGQQGNELGEYREFFNEISPLLEKLDGKPELTKAILEDKITPDLIKAVSEGKISLDDAKTVSKAQEAVKKDMGTEAFKNASPEEIEKRIDQKFDEIIAKAEEKVSKITSEAEEMSSFRKSIDDFISSKKDFSEYANDIDKWFKDHPDIYNIEVAYQAVKGAALEKKIKDAEDIRKAEEAKKIAANAGGGQSQSSGSIGSKKVVDQLISGKSNPNIF